MSYPVGQEESRLTGIYVPEHIQVAIFYTELGLPSIRTDITGAL